MALSSETDLLESKKESLIATVHLRKIIWLVEILPQHETNSSLFHNWI